MGVHSFNFNEFSQNGDPNFVFWTTIMILSGYFLLFTRIIGRNKFIQSLIRFYLLSFTLEARHVTSRHAMSALAVHNNTSRVMAASSCCSLYDG